MCTFFVVIVPIWNLDVDSARAPVHYKVLPLDRVSVRDSDSICRLRIPGGILLWFSELHSCLNIFFLNYQLQ